MRQSLAHKRPDLLLIGFTLLSVLGPFCGANQAYGIELEQKELVRELFLTETPEASERGQIQVISESSFFRRGSDREAEFSLGVTYGVTDHLEVAFNVPFDMVKTEGESSSGLGDVTAEALYCLLHTDDFVLSVAGHVTFPSGDADRDLGSGTTQWGSELIAGYRLGDIQLFGSVGGDFEPGAAALLYSFAAAAKAGPGAAIVEFSGFAGDTHEMYLTPGYVMHFGECWEVGVGVPIGLTRDSEDWGVVVKVSFET